MFQVVNGRTKIVETCKWLHGDSFSIHILPSMDFDETHRRRVACKHDFFSNYTTD